MSTPTIILSTFLVLVAIFAGYIYIVGLPPEMKRKMEEQALKTMGENKASYMTKDMLNKVPEGDQQELKDIKKGLSNAAGGALQNPLGKTVRFAVPAEAGDAADDGTRGFTGR